MIIGHSLGGDNAINLAAKLDNADINVDLLVTLDNKAIYENDTIYPNVKKAVNYYQTNQWFPSGEDIETSWFNDKTSINNIIVNNFKGHDIKHTNIDDYLSKTVVDLVKNN